jgi:hypothetical protein
MAGRSTPGSTPMTNMEMAMAAPVFPADTNAAASRSRTSSAATRRDESRLRRSAWEGVSAIVTTCEACRISSASVSARSRESSCSMTALSPTRMTEIPSSRAAVTAPSTTTAGP